MKIKDIYSPNYNKKERSKKSIKIIVIHYTGMQSERESLKRLCDFRSKVSCHYVINRKGEIYRLVSEKNIAWHAGKSCWSNYKNLNRYSIGIELVNKGHKFGFKLCHNPILFLDKTFHGNFSPGSFFLLGAMSE